jgi:hypothetical protein
MSVFSDAQAGSFPVAFSRVPRKLGTSDNNLPRPPLPIICAMANNALVSIK